MRSILSRISPRGARAALAALAVAVLGLTIGADASAGVSLSNVVVDPMAGPAVAGLPTTFKASAKFAPPSKGHEEGEDPWVQVKWNFGDGSPLQSGSTFNSGKGVDSVQHTYAQPGIYTVTCSAGHGYTLFGFKYGTSKKIKVQVACTGSNGGGKCPNGVFDAFTGTWNTPNTGQYDAGAYVVLGQAAGKVNGTIHFKTLEGKQLVIPVVKGSPHFVAVPSKSGQSLETIQFNGQATVDGVKYKYAFLLDVTTQAGLSGEVPGLVAYRKLAVTVDDTTDPGIPRFAIFTLAARETGVETTVCASLSAGVKSGKFAKPLEIVKFDVDIGSLGPACIPADRIGVDIQLTGATLASDLSVTTDRIVSEAVSLTNAVEILGSLGAGNGPKNGRAKISLAAKVNGSATQVECVVHFTDLSPVDDREFAAVTLPADLKACVPVGDDGE